MTQKCLIVTPTQAPRAPATARPGLCGSCSGSEASSGSLASPIPSEAGLVQMPTRPGVIQAAAVSLPGCLITCVATAALLLPFSEKPMAVSCVTISGLGCGEGAAAGAPAESHTHES